MPAIQTQSWHLAYRTEKPLNAKSTATYSTAAQRRNGDKKNELYVVSARSLIVPEPAKTFCFLPSNERYARLRAKEIRDDASRIAPGFFDDNHLSSCYGCRKRNV